jgi:hypothetical protein
MNKPSPWLTGVSLAMTILIGYTACAVFFITFPETGVAVLNSLFHGLDFRRLQPEASSFSFIGFGTVVAALALYGFLLGVLYASIRNRFSR